MNPDEINALKQRLRRPTQQRAALTAVTLECQTLTIQMPELTTKETAERLDALIRMLSLIKQITTEGENHAYEPRTPPRDDRQNQDRTEGAGNERRQLPRPTHPRHRERQRRCPRKTRNGGGVA